MNLQTGTLYWPTTYPDAPAYPILQENLTCDVVIIGGGSSGAQCAYYLADSGLDVVLLEKNTVGSGSTSANTAIIQYSGEKMFTHLIKTFGEAYIGRYMQLLREAINDIEAAARAISIESEFRRRDTLYCASEKDDMTHLQAEYELLKRYGFELDLLSKSEVEARYPFSRDGAIYSYNDAELNPYRYTHGLIDYAAKRGVRVYEHTAMNGHQYEHGQQQMIITTKNGHSVAARRVIFAAGYEGMEIRKEKLASFVSTYTITTTPVSDFSSWYHRTLIWETARPYLYMRTTADNRVIIGGLDENTSIAEERDRKLLHKKELLLASLRQMFPSMAAEVEADYFLTGFYGGTKDGLPIIGRYPDQPNCYYLFAYGDNGTVYSQLLAKLIVQEIVEGISPDLALFLQDRPLLEVVSS